MSHTYVTVKDSSGNPVKMAVNTLSGDSSEANEVTLIKPDGTQINPATSDNQTTANTALSAIQTAVTSATPAGTNLIGAAIAPHQTGALYSGTTALTPKFAAISTSASGAIVALVSSKKIRVLKLTLIVSAAVNVKFQSNSTDLTGLFYCGVNGGVGMGYCPLGHFETAAGEALNINLSAAVAVGGVLTYVEV